MIARAAPWWLLPVALASLFYWPITRNYFFGDDLYNLYQMVNVDLLEYLLTPYGGHLLATRNAVFYLCHWLFGAQPNGYFWVMLLTHVLNVILFFAVIRLFTGSTRLACFGATLWGASPANEGTLGWFSVYGQVIVGSLLLWILIDLGRAASGRSLSVGAAARWCVLLLFASTSFGVGLGVAAGIPLALWLILPPSGARTWGMIAAVGVLLALPPLYFGLHRRMLPPGADALAVGFLEALCMPSVWEQIMAALLQLAGYGTVCLLSADFYPRADFRTPLGYGLIAVYLAAVGGALLRASRPVKRQLLACVLLGLACYGTIVAGRGLLGRQFFLATRYQYVPLIMTTLTLCIALAQLERWRPLAPLFKNGLLAAWILFAVIAHLLASRGIDHHLPNRRASMAAVAEMRRVIDAAPSNQDVYIANRSFGGVGPLMIRNPQMFPGWAAAFVIFFPDNVVDGKRVFFVEPDPLVLQAAQRGRRTGALMVSPRPDPPAT